MYSKDTLFPSTQGLRKPVSAASLHFILNAAQRTTGTGEAEQFLVGASFHH